MIDMRVLPEEGRKQEEGVMMMMSLAREVFGGVVVAGYGVEERFV